MVSFSSYLSSFGNKPTPTPQKHRPDDLLKFKGPTSSFSSYGNQYHSFKNNQNPYVKPVTPYISNEAKISNKSIYNSSFKKPNALPSETGKRPDSLKSGQPWTGSTTYKNLFNPPKKSSSMNSRCDSRSNLSSLNPEVGFKHQY